MPFRRGVRAGPHPHPTPHARRSSLKKLSTTLFAVLLVALISLLLIALRLHFLDVGSSQSNGASRFTRSFARLWNNSSPHPSLFVVKDACLRFDESSAICSLRYGAIIVADLNYSSGELTVLYPEKGRLAVQTWNESVVPVSLKESLEELASCSKTVYEHNIDYNGGDIDAETDVQVTSETECCFRCRNHQQCLAWTYAGDQGCWLKGAGITKITKQGVVSGLSPAKIFSKSKLEGQSACDHGIRDQLRHVVFFDTPARDWMRSVPVGNGRIGALLGAGPGIHIERIPLSADTLYVRNSQSVKPKKTMVLTVRAIRDLLLKGEFGTAENLARSLSAGTVGSFQYAAELWIHCHSGSNAASPSNSMEQYSANHEPQRLRMHMSDNDAFSPFIPLSEESSLGRSTYMTRALNMMDGVHHVSFLTLQRQETGQVRGIVHSRQWIASSGADVIMSHYTCFPTPGLAAEDFTPCLHMDLALGRVGSAHGATIVKISDRFGEPLKEVQSLNHVHHPWAVVLELVVEEGDKDKESPRTSTFVGIQTDGVLNLKEGEKTSQGTSFILGISDASTAVLAISICVEHKQAGIARSLGCEGKVMSALSRGWTSVYKEHVEDFSTFMKASDIHLATGRSGCWQVALNTRMERLKEKSLDFDLGIIEQAYRYGKYLAVASSRHSSQPMNLQGLWADGLQAAWKGDYHLNINLQMNYWPVMALGMTDVALPYFTFMSNLAHSGQVTARRMYNSSGWVAHGYTDIWMDTLAWDDMQWSLCASCGAWAAVQLWDMYTYMYTNEDNETQLLFKQVQFILRGAVEYLVSTAFPWKDWFLTGPTTSPENSFEFVGAELKSNADRKFHFMTLSPAIDVCVYTELVNSLEKSLKWESLPMKASDVELLSRAREIVSRFPGADFDLINQGKIDEYPLHKFLPFKFSEPDAGHRHFSSLLWLYPFGTVADAKIMDAARETMRQKLEDGGAHTNWSCVWAIALLARLGDSQRVWSLLQRYFKSYVVDNLLSIHPPTQPMDSLPACQTCFREQQHPHVYTPLVDFSKGLKTAFDDSFQIDANMGLVAAIHEMLLFTHKPGEIHLLPALPEPLSTGRVYTLRGRGGVLVSFSWSNRLVVRATLHFPRLYCKHVRTQLQSNELRSCSIAILSPNMLSLIHHESSCWAEDPAPSSFNHALSVRLQRLPCVLDLQQ